MKHVFSFSFSHWTCLLLRNMAILIEFHIRRTPDCTLREKCPAASSIDNWRSTLFCDQRFPRPLQAPNDPRKDSTSDRYLSKVATVKLSNSPLILHHLTPILANPKRASWTPF